MWQWPILEQKEEQGSLSLAWHLSPVKPEGQVQRKLAVKGDGGVGEPGRAGSRAWQLPPFWQSWASWQGSGNWHVSPKKPGAHWQVPWPSEMLRQVPPLAQGPEKLLHGSPLVSTTE